MNDNQDDDWSRKCVHFRERGEACSSQKEFGCTCCIQIATIIRTSSCSNHYITKDVTSPQKKKDMSTFRQSKDVAVKGVLRWENKRKKKRISECQCKLCPHLVPYRRGHSLLKQFTNLLALPRLRSGCRRHHRDPFQLARSVRLNRRAHATRPRRCHWRQ